MASVFTFLGSLTYLRGLHIPALDLVTNFLAASLIAYAILRHHLIDINLIFEQTLFSILAIILLTTVYLGFMLVLTLVFHIRWFDTSTGRLVIALIAAFIAMISYPFHTQLERGLERALFPQRYRRQHLLKELEDSLQNLLDVPTLCRKVVNELAIALEVSPVIFWTLNRSQSEFVLQAETGSHHLQWNIPTSFSVIEHFLQTETPIFHQDFPLLKNFPNSESSQIEVLFPLKSQQKILGVIGIGSKKNGTAFTQEEYHLLTKLMEKIYSALENAILLQEESRRREVAEILQAVILQITPDIQVERVLDNILLHLATLIEYDSACIFLLQGDQLTAVAARGFSNTIEVLGKSYSVLDDPLFTQMIQMRRPLLIPVLEPGIPFRGYGGTNLVRSWIGVPLMARGVVIGCLTLDHYTPNAYYSPEQASIVQTFANHASIVIENSRLMKVEREQRLIAESLREIGAVLDSTLEMDSLLDLLIEQVGRLIPYSIAFLYLVENNTPALVRKRICDTVPNDKVEALDKISIHLENSPYFYHLLESYEPMILPFIEPAFDWVESSLSLGSWISAPIIAKNKIIACFSLISLQPNLYTTHHASLLATFCSEAALALQNARLFSEVQRLATLDDLTGILNRRQLFIEGRREFSRAKRYHRPLSLLMIDLDHFKEINDTFGHATGDEILKSLAHTLRKTIRDVDIFGRYGGEEFVLVLPETSKREAKSIAERLRKIIEQTLFSTPAGEIHTTISIGVAQQTEDVQTFEELLERADQALYRAKNGGRNQVEEYDTAD